MVLRQNIDELISIAVTAHEKYTPYHHEFRTPYFFYHDESSEKLKDMLLPRERLDTIICQLDDLGYKNTPYDFNMDIQKYDDIMKQRKTSMPLLQKAKNSNMFQIIPPKDDFYTVRINADGSGKFNEDNENFNLHDIVNPYLFFAEKLTELQKKEANLFLIKNENYLNLKLIYDQTVKFYIDETIIYDNEYVFLSGWMHKPFHNILNKYIFLSTDDTADNYNEKIMCQVRTRERLDVVNCLNDDTGRNSGFECIFELEKVRSISKGTVNILGILENDGCFLHGNPISVDFWM